MKHVLLFPGQGSQSVGMLGGHDAATLAPTWAEAAEALGWDVGALVRDGPAAELNQTQKTQPALLAAGVAIWRLWSAHGLPLPVALAGHSLGEYTALVAAGSLGFGDALRLVELRGRLMQEAVPAGAGGMMALIGLDDGAVEQLCASYDGPGVLEPVNYNAPGQVVVAGETAALDWLGSVAKKSGARLATRLPVSVPSHCSLMRGAADALYERLQGVEVRAPQVPVLHNLDGAARTEPDAIRLALREQLYRPVRWTQTIQALVAQGCDTYFECGPGRVLCGLNKRITTGTRCQPLEDPAGMDAAQALLVNEGAKQ